MRINKTRLIVLTLVVCGIAVVAADFFFQPPAKEVVEIKEVLDGVNYYIPTEEETTHGNDMDLRLSIENRCVEDLIANGEVTELCQM